MVLNLTVPTNSWDFSNSKIVDQSGQSEFSNFSKKELDQFKHEKHR